MSTQILSSTAEILLEQIINSTSLFNCEVDKPELKQSLSLVLAQYDIKPAAISTGHPDLQQKVTLFIAGKRLEGLSHKTLDGYILELKIFGKHIHKTTAEITTSDIRVYLGKYEHLKVSTISRKLSVAKSFFGWLRSELIIPSDPTTRIKQPKKEKRTPKALTIEEFEMIREACITPRERALVEVFYATGGRLAEVQEMNRTDIDFQAMSVRVVGKGDKERPVYFSFKAMYHLKKYFKMRTDAVPALFVTERKPYRRLGQAGIQHAFKKIAKRSEVTKNVHPHVFRHTFATLMLNNGAELASVQALLGHADPATTMVYTNVTDEKRKQSHRQYLVQ